MSTRPVCERRRQSGAAAVEMAIVSTLFFMAFLGVVEMGWLLFQWNTTAEATRLAARTAAVCDLDAPIIKQKARGLLRTLQADTEVVLTYLPAGCNADTCTTVTVAIQAASNLPNFNPLVPNALRLPRSTTTLPRESMASVLAGGNNPVCQ